MTNISFGSLLKSLRARSGMNQRELGRRMGVRRATISDWERGNHLPRYRDQIERIVNELGGTEAELQQLLAAAFLPQNQPQEKGVQTPVAPDHPTQNLEDESVANLRKEILASDSPFLEVTKRAPRRVVDSVIGAKGWESLLHTLAGIAIEGGRPDWAMRMTEAIAEEMERTWQRTGWIQATAAIGPLLQHFEGRERMRHIRRSAETALLRLIPRREGSWEVLYPWGEVLGASLQALAPLSPPAAKRFAQELDETDELGWGRREIRRQLANTGRLAPYLTVSEEEDPFSAGKVSLEQALQEIERECRCRVSEMGLPYLEVLMPTLSGVGTDEAATWLGEWLVEQAGQIETGPNNSELANWVTYGVSLWQADVRHLYRGLDIVLDSSVPPWMWRGYLRGVMRLGRTDATVYLAALMEREGRNWTAEQRKVVVGTIGGRGDERVAPYLARWWDREWERRETTPSDLRIWVGEALWGPEGDRGVLVRRSTEWLVDWLEDADVSDDFRLAAAIWVLCPRYLVDGKKNLPIAELGRRWLARGTEEANFALARAGAYLTDSASKEEFDALEELERGLPQDGRVHIAARLGLWQILKLELEEALGKGRALHDWEMVKLAAEQQYLAVLPLLVDHYLDGKEWIKDADLHSFHYQDIDECLDRRWEERGMRIERRTAGLLWRLGTPGAVTRVLNALREGEEIICCPSGILYLGHMARAHRESVWPLLAEFLEEVEDEEIRWDIFGAIQHLWEMEETWPWEVTAFFFDRLEDSDKYVVAQAQSVLWGRARELSGPVWKGRAEIYRQRLQELALMGTERQRQLASAWLDLTLFEEQEASEELVEEKAGLRTEERAGQELLKVVCQKENLAMDNLDAVRDRALNLLVKRRRHLGTLWQAVQRGEVPDGWLIAAVAVQGLVVEEVEGELFIRRGEARLPLEE